MSRQATALLDASQNRVLAFKAFDTTQLGYCITEDATRQFQ